MTVLLARDDAPIAYKLRRPCPYGPVAANLAVAHLHAGTPVGDLFGKILVFKIRLEHGDLNGQSASNCVVRAEADTAANRVLILGRRRGAEQLAVRIPKVRMAWKWIGRLAGRRISEPRESRGLGDTLNCVRVRNRAKRQRRPRLVFSVPLERWHRVQRPRDERERSGCLGPVDSGPWLATQLLG